MAELVADELRRLDATCADGPSSSSRSSPPSCARSARPPGTTARRWSSSSPTPRRRPLLTRAGLREISTYAQGIGPSRDRLLSSTSRPDRVAATLVDEAHRAALSSSAGPSGPRTLSFPSTCAAASARRSGDAARRGPALLALGVDGLITDSPDHAVAAARSCSPSSDIALLECSSRFWSPAGPPEHAEHPWSGPLGQSMRSWISTFSSRPGPTPITLIRAPASSSSRFT